MESPAQYPLNVLGHALLRIATRCLRIVSLMKQNPGKMQSLVEHGDVSALSIYAIS